MAELIFGGMKIQSKIAEFLLNSRRSIKIAVSWFNNATLFLILLNRLENNISVELILNKDDNNIGKKNSLDFDEFLNKGGILHWAIGQNKYQKHHVKICIVDNEAYISGSYNWTNNATTNNEEEVSIIRDKAAVNAAIEKYNEWCSKIPAEKNQNMSLESLGHEDNEKVDDETAKNLAKIILCPNCAMPLDWAETEEKKCLIKSFCYYKNKYPVKSMVRTVLDIYKTDPLICEVYNSCHKEFFTEAELTDIFTHGGICIDNKPLEYVGQSSEFLQMVNYLYQQPLRNRGYKILENLAISFYKEIESGRWPNIRRKSSNKTFYHSYLDDEGKFIETSQRCFSLHVIFEYKKVKYTITYWMEHLFSDEVDSKKIAEDGLTLAFRDTDAIWIERDYSCEDTSDAAEDSQFFKVLLMSKLKSKYRNHARDALNTRYLFDGVFYYKNAPNVFYEILDTIETIIK